MTKIIGINVRGVLITPLHIGPVPHPTNPDHPIIIELVVATDLSAVGPAIYVSRAKEKIHRNTSTNRSLHRSSGGLISPGVAGVGADVTAGPRIIRCSSDGRSLHGHVGGERG